VLIYKDDTGYGYHYNPSLRNHGRSYDCIHHHGRFVYVHYSDMGEVGRAFHIARERRSQRKRGVILGDEDLVSLFIEVQPYTSLSFW